MNSSDLQRLRGFVHMLKANPEFLLTPDLAFFKEYIEELGGKIPASVKETKPKPEEKKPEPKVEPKVESKPKPEEKVEVKEEEEEVEEDSGRVSPDNDPPQPMFQGNEVTEEQSDLADKKKQEAMDALSSENLNGAIQLLTDAIISAANAPLYSLRASVYLRLKKPNAAIRDCDAAIALNPDSAKSYKMRGRAYRMLGNWENSAKDLRLGNKLDYDDSTYEIQKFVEEKFHKISERKKKREEEERKRRPTNHSRGDDDNHGFEFPEMGGMGGGMGGGENEGFPGMGGMGGFPGMGGDGGFPGMGGMGGMNAGSFNKLFSDPELMAAFQDPEIAPIILEIQQNPNSLEKYKNNPKVMSLLTKLQTLFQQ